MFRIDYCLILIAAGSLSPASAQAKPELELSIGVHRVQAEVVNTEAARMHGLMGRRTLPRQQGMLFVFDSENRHCMWMKNTLIPLSVAFVDDQGRIVNIEEMAPQTEDNHCAARPVRYALEMNGGWFRERRLGPGDYLSGIERAPPAR